MVISVKIDVKVNYALIQLKYKTEILTTPDDPNEDATRHSVKWTNNVGWEKAEIDIVSSFKVDESPPEKPGYITYFQYGVTRASVELQFENGGNFGLIIYRLNVELTTLVYNLVVLSLLILRRCDMENSPLLLFVL